MYLYQIMHADNTDLSCLLVCLSSAVWCKVSRPDTSTPSTPPWQGPGPHPVTAYIQHMTFKVLMLHCEVRGIISSGKEIHSDF